MSVRVDCPNEWDQPNAIWVRRLGQRLGTWDAQDIEVAMLHAPITMWIEAAIGLIEMATFSSKRG